MPIRVIQTITESHSAHLTSIRTAFVADFNGDQIPDIVGIDENKGLMLFYGQRSNFSSGISLFESLKVPYALSIADLNNDGRMDIIVGYVLPPRKYFIVKELIPILNQFHLVIQMVLSMDLQ